MPDVCRNSLLSRRSQIRCTLTRLAVAYTLVLAFVASLPVTCTADAAAHRSQKSGRRLRGTHRTLAAAKAVHSLAVNRFRSPEHRTALPDTKQQTPLSPPVVTLAHIENSSASTEVFRPLRC